MVRPATFAVFASCCVPCHVTAPATATSLALQRHWPCHHNVPGPCNGPLYLFNVTNPPPERSWYLLNVTNPAPERSWYLFNLTNPAHERCWYLFSVTNPALERSWYLFDVTNPTPERS